MRQLRHYFAKRHRLLPQQKPRFSYLSRKTRTNQKKNIKSNSKNGKKKKMDDDYNISYGIYSKEFSSHLPTPREYRFPSNRPFSLSEPRHLRSKYVSRAKQASPRAFPELRLRQPGPTIKTSCPLKTNDHRNICSNALPPEFQIISLKI